MRSTSLLSGLLILVASVLLITCKKGTRKDNESPQTVVTPHIINQVGENRLKSTVRLSWMGSDPDGYVEGFEISQDGQNWFYTTEFDSTFVFDIAEGSDTTDIDFYVRAIDNQGVKDPSPAYVRVPIKNSPPEVTFNQNFSTTDTAFLVATLFWEASDPDGFENLKNVRIRINEGDWYEVDKSIENLTLIPENLNGTGSMNATVWFNSTEAESSTISGLKVNDTNNIYIQSVDIANSESEIDTIQGLYFKNKTSDLLVIGADISENAFYRQHIGNVYPTYDYIDYAIDNGKWQPTFWDPTFSLLIKQYEKVCIFSDRKPYFNENTKKENLIFESSARSIQDYYNSGGQIFTIGYFPSNLDSNSIVFGVFPMDRSTRFNGSVFLKAGSTTVTGAQGYPDLQPTSFSPAVSPFVPSSDAESIMTADLDEPVGWNGPDHVGARRQLAGKTYQVHIGIGLYDANGIPANTDALFDKVLNQEFN